MDEETDIEAAQTIVGYTSIEETLEEVRVHLDIDGADPEDIYLDVHEEGIEIYAPLEARTFVHRFIPLSQQADADAMECSLEHGHLDLIIPKGQT